MTVPRDIVIKEKADREPFESVSKIDLVKDALSSKGETDAVKNEVIKAMKSLREEVKATKVDVSEPEPKINPLKIKYEKDDEK